MLCNVTCLYCSVLRNSGHWCYQEPSSRPRSHSRYVILWIESKFFGLRRC